MLSTRSNYPTVVILESCFTITFYFVFDDIAILQCFKKVQQYYIFILLFKFFYWCSSQNHDFVFRLLGIDFG